MAVPLMHPAPGSRLVRFVGDTVVFTLSSGDTPGWPAGWRAMVRTTLGRGAARRRAIIAAAGGPQPLAGAEWRDLPMRRRGDVWVLEMPLTEVGFFHAKAFAVDEQGWQRWPEGPDAGISVHPDSTRTANTIYCAFTRLFGASRTKTFTSDPAVDMTVRELDEAGYAVIPPSGKLRDVRRELPHIFETLGCRILHLLPVNPTPTTYARYGRYGSPYAALDLTAIDPALVEFDRRTTGVQQFVELADAVHERGGRLFLDLVINHTGWGSTLQENHPEWFLHDATGGFVSPGAWGNTWLDLVELEPHHFGLWHELAEVFLTWCRRGVDGFRCDAGYKVPMPVWRYITARVREEFPDAVFLLEGLGGGWGDTENLLTEGGMQWAYSELFQEYSGAQVAGYLQHAFTQSARAGLLVHYSETHDNLRLAARSPAWSLLRNRLSALASVSGGFGFTCGVEWLAPEKIDVHSCRGLNWGHGPNLVSELGALNRLLAHHPAFFDGATCRRLSHPEAPVYVLLRESAEGADAVLVIINTDSEHAQELSLAWEHPDLGAGPSWAAGKWVDLLGQPSPAFTSTVDGGVRSVLDPGACYCLSRHATPQGRSGEEYRAARARAAWVLQAAATVVDPAALGGCDWVRLAAWADEDPAGVLGALSTMNQELARADFPAALRAALDAGGYRPVVVWRWTDRRRITPIPAHHWLLVLDDRRFRATLTGPDGASRRVEGVAVRAGFAAWFPPGGPCGEATLEMHRLLAQGEPGTAQVRYLAERPGLAHRAGVMRPDDLVLLTNGRGGMARLHLDLGRITSKYDCVLGANLHPRVPVDRHVFVKRLRLWANAGGFISPLDATNLRGFERDPVACWEFVVNAGDGRAVGIRLTAAMLEGENTVAFRLERVPLPKQSSVVELAGEVPVKLTARFDLEDRSFHGETQRNGGAEFHFQSNVHPLPSAAGFAFTPAQDRQVRVWTSAGRYHEAPEWSQGLPHSVEASRGMVGGGDAYSPGWFDFPVALSSPVTLVVTAESARGPGDPLATSSEAGEVAGTSDLFGAALERAAGAFVVRRLDGRTVIAGYPWFLDWGRDTLIAVRGLLAAGRVQEVEQILVTFARFEEGGTLPNAIHGENASNRETSDAPLWFGLACADYAALRTALPGRGLDRVVDVEGRTLLDVLRSIAAGYIAGTPSGVQVDPASGLVWSPSHFTWMDTNHPAGTPREGYPVEIQVLWIRLLRFLAECEPAGKGTHWRDGAELAARSLRELYWLEQEGWLADGLLAARGTPASGAVRDTALRPNMLFAVSLGEITGSPARRCVEAASRYLVVPGGLRSLAPLPVSPPLPIRAADGRLLNDPVQPYWGHYLGDEDTSRKPAYHNGTVWVWLLGVFCEALVAAWEGAPSSVAAARSYLVSLEELLQAGCVGQLPENLDGDAPHTQRGCDAQAWSVTEALRVWRKLSET